MAKRRLTQQHIGHPVCGDRVVWQPVDATTGVVTALLPRDSVLSSPDYIGQDKRLAGNIPSWWWYRRPNPPPAGTC